MAENLFCDHCSTPAAFFGFTQPDVKVKVCREHIDVLLDKRVAIFDIEAFRLMKRPQDFGEFEDRRRTVLEGCGQIDALESQLESDWTHHQQLLHSHHEQTLACIQRVYAELWLRCEQRYAHIKEQLHNVRSCLQLYTQDLHCAPPEPVSTAFTVQLQDCRLSLAQTLLNAFSFDPMSMAPPCDQELTYLLALSASEAEVRATAEAVERSSSEACRLGHFSEAVAELQRGRSFLQQHNSYSLDLPLACTLFQSYQFTPTVSLCEAILQTERSPLEHLSALCYLIHSLYELDENDKACALIEKWTAQLAVGCVDSQCVLFYIKARQQYVQDKYSKAKELYEQALQLGVLPTSYLTAYSLVDLGILYQREGNKTKAERLYLRSCSILSEHFPCSYGYGVCLNSLGALYRDMNRLDEAEERQMQAYQLLSLFPQSRFLGLCVFNMGALCAMKGENRAAREKLEEALPLLKRHGYTAEAVASEEALKSLF